MLTGSGNVRLNILVLMIMGLDPEMKILTGCFILLISTSTLRYRYIKLELYKQANTHKDR
jgi:hypothetical protein